MASGTISVNRMKLLWSNSNTGNTFSPQSISLDLDEYSAVLITTNHFTNNDSRSTHYIPVDGNQYIMTSPNNGQVGTAKRKVVANGSKVQFYGGYSGSTAIDNACIPVQIFGVKL